MNTPSFVESATSAFLVIPHAHIARKSMTRKLPPAVMAKVRERLARDGKPMAGFNSTIELFGGHQKDYRTHVVAPRAAIHTFIYQNTVPLNPNEGGAKAAGPRLLLVSKAADFLTGLSVLKAEAQAKFESFMKDYGKYCAAGRIAADHNVAAVGLKVTPYMSDAWPDPQEFRRAMYIDIAPPQPLAVLDVSKFNLPADVAAQIAAQSSAQLEKQLSSARGFIIDKASAHMAHVEKQLTSGDRLSDALIRETNRWADQLDGVGKGMNDTDLQAIAARMKADIGSVPSKDAWRDDYATKRASREAASDARKALKEAKSKPLAADKSAPKKSGFKPLDVGMLPDLIKD